MDYERVMRAAVREVERKARRIVEHEFSVCRPDEEVPFIGGEFPPPEEYDRLREKVIRALCARKWFEYEAPLWAQPLPLRTEDCTALFNQPNRRLIPVGEYGIQLRAMGWRLDYAKPFEVFCARYVPRPEHDS